MPREMSVFEALLHAISDVRELALITAAERRALDGRTASNVTDLDFDQSRRHAAAADDMVNEIRVQLEQIETALELGKDRL